MLPHKRVTHQGANVNQQSTANLRLTALHLACLAGNEGVASLLLSHNANPALADDLGRLPLSLIHPSNPSLRERVSAVTSVALASPSPMKTPAKAMVRGDVN